jgi:hypothetical protein
MTTEEMLLRQVRGIRERIAAGGLKGAALEARLDQLEAVSREVGVLQQVRLSRVGHGYAPVLESLGQAGETL